MEFPKVYQAAKRFKGAEWALCDALVAEIPAGRSMADALKRCSRELVTQGLEFTPEYLGKLHSVGRKFTARARGEATPYLAITAGTPGVLAKAVKVAESEGRPVTSRLVKDVRKAALRPTKHLPPKQRTKAASDQPVSEIRRHANIGKLERAAIIATKAGRDFVGDVAGMELDAESRSALLEDIENVLMVWKAAKQSLSGRSISDEAEAFLQTL